MKKTDMEPSGLDLSKLNPDLVEFPQDLAGGSKNRTQRDSDEAPERNTRRGSRRKENDRNEDENIDSDRENNFDDGRDDNEDDDNVNDNQEEDNFEDDDRERNEDFNEDDDFREERGSRFRGRERFREDPEIFGTLMTQMGQLQAELAQLKNSQSGGRQGISEEQWAQLESDTGMSRRGLELVLNSSQRIQQNIMDQVSSRMAKLERRSMLYDLSREKGLEDSMRYEKDVEEFCKELPPNMQLNEKMIRYAVLAAKSRGHRNVINRERWSREHRRRVVDRIQDRNIDRNYSSKNRDRSEKGGELGALQDRIRRKFGMNKKEYKELSTGRR